MRFILQKSQIPIGNCYNVYFNFLRKFEIEIEPNIKEKVIIEEEKESLSSIPGERNKTIVYSSDDNDCCSIKLDTHDLNTLKNDNYLQYERPKEKSIDTTSKTAFKLLNFYKNKKAFLKYEILLGSQYFLYRIFLMIFLINSSLNKTIFSHLYLLVVFVICFKSPKSLLVFIKNFSLSVIYIHYIFFLVNINRDSSPRLIPFFNNYNFQPSLLIYLLDQIYDEQKRWFEFFSFGINYSEFASFFFISLIVFFLQLYIFYYFYLQAYIIKSIDKRYLKYVNFDDQSQKQFINYQNWKDPEYSVPNQFYNFLHMGFQMALICFLCFFIVIRFSLPNFLLFMPIIFFIGICETSFKWPYYYEKIVFIKLSIRVIQVLCMIFLILLAIFSNPFFYDGHQCQESIWGQKIRWCREILDFMTVYDKYIGLIVLQLGIDLIKYSKYEEVCLVQCSKKLLKVKFLFFFENFNYLIV